MGMNPAALLVILASPVLLTGCLGGLLEKQPDYVPDTLLEIRRTDRGDDYWGFLGETSTTDFEAVLSGTGECYLYFSYADSEWLDADSLTIDLEGSLPRMRIAAVDRFEDGTGTKYERGLVPVRRYLFREMAAMEAPLIALEGAQGTVMLRLGRNGTNRLKELVAYADDQWPDQD